MPIVSFNFWFLPIQDFQPCKSFFASICFLLKLTHSKIFQQHEKMFQPEWNTSKIKNVQITPPFNIKYFASIDFLKTLLQICKFFRFKLEKLFIFFTSVPYVKKTFR